MLVISNSLIYSLIYYLVQKRVHTDFSLVLFKVTSCLIVCHLAHLVEGKKAVDFSAHRKHKLICCVFSFSSVIHTHGIFIRLLVKCWCGEESKTINQHQIVLLASPIVDWTLSMFNPPYTAHSSIKTIEKINGKKKKNQEMFRTQFLALNPRHMHSLRLKCYS